MPAVSRISGDPATVYVNRQYLLKAIGFGLRTIGVQETLEAPALLRWGRQPSDDRHARAC